LHTTPLPQWSSRKKKHEQPLNGKEAKTMRQGAFSCLLQECFKNLSLQSSHTISSATYRSIKKASAPIKQTAQRERRSYQTSEPFSGKIWKRFGHLVFMSGLRGLPARLGSARLSLEI
jgi:hypothetical protein